jgi:hypothetical protein
MVSMKSMLAVALVISLLGCSIGPAKSVLTNPAPISLDRRLDPRKSVYIALPEDGESGNVAYIGSGRAVAQAIGAAFRKRGIAVHVGEGKMTNEDALAAATRLKAGYMVLSVITLWEQRNKWLGRPSKVAVRVTIADAATGRAIESKSIETRNRTVIAFSIVDPETLLEEPLKDYVSGLY